MTVAGAYCECLLILASFPRGTVKEKVTAYKGPLHRTLPCYFQ